jgi:5-methylcytosine-specific restriction protein B
MRVQELISDEKATQTSNETNEGINYWWLNASPKIWSFSNIEVGQAVEYTLFLPG